MSKDKEKRQRIEAIELLLLGKIQELLREPKPDYTAIDLLGKQLKNMADMKITEDWIRKFETAIQNNPSLALPPGVMQGSVAQRFKTLAGITEKGSKRDKRFSKNKRPHPLAGTPWEKFPVVEPEDPRP